MNGVIINTFNNHTPSFKARNSDIRFADDVMRNALKEFPYSSPSRIIMHINNYKLKLSQKQKSCFFDFASRLKVIRDNKPAIERDPVGYLLTTIASIKKFKLANCSDSANLMKAAFHANGIDSKIVSLYGYYQPKHAVNLEHDVLLVKLSKNAVLSDPKTYGKNAYIVDAWNGFVDYVPNAFLKFRENYSNDFRMVGVKNFGFGLNHEYDISPQANNIILANFPELKIKSKKEKP